MSKRPTNAGDGAAALTASVRARLAAGRSMAALKEAKELVKRFPGETADELLVAAYRARISDLARAGMHAEARELVGVAGARFASRAEEWRALGVATARAGGDVDDVLARWRGASDDAAAREGLAEELRQAVLDPRAVAESGVLAPEDPLRAAARAVDLAFTAAAAGALSDAMREGLRAVGRRSPLLDWRNFVLALDAFHRHDDAACTSRLETIAAGSAVARGKQILLARLRGEAIGATGTATRRLELRLSDGFVEVAAPLAGLRAQNASPRARTDAARSLLTGLAAKSARLTERVMGHLRGRPEFERIVEELDDGLGARLLGPAEWLRATADRNAARDPVVGLVAWLGWLMPRTTGHDLRRLADVELAELLERIARIGFAAGPQLLDLLGPEVLLALSDPSALRARLADLVDVRRGGDVEAAMTAVAMLGEVRDRLRRHTNAVVSAPPPLDLVEYATVLDPIAARFERLVERMPDDRSGQRDSEVFLERWAAAVPQDPEPLVRLARAAERRRALKKALGYLARAEARNAVDERVRTARLRVQMAQLREHHRAGRVHLCAGDLQQLDANPAAQSGFARAFLAGVRGELALDGASDLLAAAGSAARGAAVARLARAVLADDDTCVQLDPAPLGEQLALLAWLIRVAEAFDVDPTILAPLARDLAVEIPDADIPAADADRLALCRHAEAVGDWGLVASISGRGLLDDGPHLARYLLLRARAHEWAGQGRSRALAMRRLAKALALRVGDRATARAAEAGFGFGRADLDELDASQVRELLESERGRARARSQPQTPRRHRTPGRALPFSGGGHVDAESQS